MVASVAPAAADTGDGSATVRVVREVNADGKWNQALEPGMAGVQVVLTDADGRSITGTTQTDGTVKLAPGSSLAGGKYRVEVKNPEQGVLFPGFASPRKDLIDPTELSSNVEFVDLSAGKNAEITTSFWSPEDYCQKNATLVTACMNASIPTSAPAGKRTLTSFPYSARGTYNQLTDLANQGQTGTVWGIGYNRVTKQLFSAAYAKRGTVYGPGGPGAIYRTNPATKQTALFTRVPNAGVTQHQLGVRMDEAFGPVVGKEALGDLDVSPDGKDLYVVNLHDRRLYRYDATQSTAAQAKASYPIKDPGCAAPGDWRPSGLGFKDGKVYVGGVCSAQSTGSKADMRAVVQVFDPTTGQFTGTVMDQPLNYPRMETNYGADGRCFGATWYPWSNVRPATQDGHQCTGAAMQNPEPILSDIVFETNGDMVVGFGDRFSDRTGWVLPATPNAPATTAFEGGDINRACRGGNHMFVLDGNGGCKNNASPATNGGHDEPNVKEFYPGDWSAGMHREVSEGGLALSKVETTIPFTSMDPNISTTAHGWTGSGVRWVDRNTGTANTSTDGNYLNEDFGKTRGIADLEVLCDEAPLQIGNRVWQDADGDGIQDPGEKPVVGATVNIYDADGNKIGTAVTNERGEYYFDSTVAKNVEPEDLKYGRTYTIKMDNPADYKDGGPLLGWAPTRPNEGDNDQVDSNGETGGNPFPAIEVTPQGAGHNDQSADFGFMKPEVDLSVIKIGKPKPATPGGEIVYDIIVTNNGPNRSSGWTITDPLPDGLTNARTFNAGCAIAGTTLTCTGGPLDVGESHTITVRGDAPKPETEIKLTNCINVKGNETDPNMDNNRSCEEIIVPAVPVIDPAIGGAAAAAAVLGGAVLLRRRRGAGEAMPV
ncbi:SdrD B-like domain-containing protein [Streptomyces sp. S.PB5]|uniref:SdrD B-like domain-containing protein n=1 Tax=Streptomyces sp. S.PB5 TaxID=3020844 RepID=UPI0025AFC027|nr:SdrD B-like domain-containing protein [Streptomyces sp. S.PB5]MDN3025999.1 SdrD B-like domain-containing protein [Streptomyces sp. S.PB5]